MRNLNGNENAVFEAAVESSAGNGHDFGCTQDVSVPGMSGQQIGAYLTILQTKGLIYCHPAEMVNGAYKVTQFELTEAGFQMAGVER
jgi:hypothetical protein